MFLRPQKTHWFELYVPRHETVRALSVLARAGSVQLDDNPKVNASLEIEQIRKYLAELAALEARYHEQLPQGQYCPVELPLSPQDTAEQTLQRLREWAAEVDDIPERLHHLEQEQQQLQHLLAMFSSEEASQLDLARLATPMSLLYVGLNECPVGETFAGLPGGTVLKNVAADARRYVVVAGLPEQGHAIGKAMAAHGCEPLPLPTWLSNDRDENIARIAARIAALAKERDVLRRTLDSLAERYRLVELLGNISVLRWYVKHAPQVEAGTRFCHVTGWTSDPDETRLNEIFRKEHVNAIVRFPQVPESVATPTALSNPEWVRPFEFFTQMFGTPGRTEVDPSGLLTVIVPLLFGYMFPDVGHGLLLILAAVLFARRWPQITFLIPCGVSAIAWGFAFGEFFSFDKLIPALWLKPLSDPLTVMLAPMIGGVLLLLLGILLASLEARWRGELTAWLAMDAAVLFMYASALTALFHRGAGYGIVIGAVWYLLGGLAIDHIQPLQRLLALSGRLLESVFQLTLNTLSFARVGAFALGHVALSSALISLLASIETPVLYVALLVLGNLFIVAIAGLVVFVQTTRLVLFEFFIRFLRAEGRIFKPLRGPTAGQG
jgi:V/A-type H+/Na+-transporting ATPase subunit I